ncbi:hypothetical protein PsorP6_006468 [Peronosclerospora sorghi]|uniref:Uncharacterized protein n=1 Tax=Peronosclerospora sorghi TaxID=230839 RepID=A0ACC0W773_9STRA|nr:hypothetical protein PsorP6_006468 [Peronosclerospora sorghi]
MKSLGLNSNLIPNTPTGTSWTFSASQDDATDGIIYDWFVDHGTRPVYITPARVIVGIRSRSRRVFFNQKTPPKCVMVDPRTPFRQIQFTGQGFTVVHHRINAYNQHVPPLIKEIKERQSAAKEIKDKKTAAKDDDDNGSTTPAVEECSDSSDNADMSSSDDDNTSSACNDDSATSDNVAMASESDSDSEPQSGDQLESIFDEANVSMASESDSDSEPQKSDSGEANTIEEIRDENEEPTFPVDPIRSDDFAPARIHQAKHMVFGTIEDPQVDFQPFPPSQKEYPMLASVNSFEWLSEGMGDTIPPDHDIILWDKSCKPPRSVGSYVIVNPVSESLLNSKVYQGNVEKLSLQELCSEIDQFLGSFDSSTETDNFMSSIQSQTILHMALLDSASKDNYKYLRNLAFGHAYLYGPITAGFYNREGSIVTASPIMATLDDSTLETVIMPPLIERILNGPLPASFRETIGYLRGRATSQPYQMTLTPNVQWALPGYYINANGFKNVTQRMLNYLSNNFHIVGLQETRFTGLKSFMRAKFLWKKSSQLNSSFWYQENMNSYTGQSGVGLLHTPSVPLHNPLITSDILERYLIVHGKIDSVDTYIHVVNASAQPSHRKRFFSSLPRYFHDDSQHIVVSDFNTVLSRHLDQDRSERRARAQGREELLQWIYDLHLVDTWRLQHPDLQEFTSPNRSSRIDYVFVSSRLFHYAFQNSFHNYSLTIRAGGPYWAFISTWLNNL